MQHEDRHLQSEDKLKPTAQNGHRKPSLGRPATTFTRGGGVEELPAAVFRKKKKNPMRHDGALGHVSRSTFDK